MSCLSYFSNWDPIQLQDCLTPDVDMFIPVNDSFLFQPKPQPQQQHLCQEQASSFGFDPLGSFSDSLLLPQETFCPNPNTDPLNLPQDLDSFFPAPKRQKITEPSYQCNTLDHFANPNPNFVDSYLDIVPEGSTTFPEFRIPDFPVAFDAGRADHTGCNNAKKTQLSAQSIAARQRRRRIAEKTQELGKLIPGGQKLNTAEMFQAAAKYVVFLQAQVGILQLMQSEMPQENPNVEREIRALLASQTMQEKFSSEEVCLAPRKMVQTLAADESIWKTPRMFQDINRLLSAHETDKF
ncbi:PREDICTED: transcription factor bHLH53-like [Tarenaya hassleriana]|uniref:transcription factor bHLH53-like n=1 Tax=Tarenaya hassleriana TaxID=28532 RepID=UPI00053C42F3|nr:PREDICTED: transcription factor bHLH53-like [Tarenaya hassleriana]